MKVILIAISFLMSLILIGCIPAGTASSGGASRQAASTSDLSSEKFHSLREGERHTKFQVTTGKNNPRNVDTTIDFQRNDTDFLKRPSGNFDIDICMFEARSDDVFLPPILISTSFKPLNTNERNLQIKLLGGIFGVTQIMHDENDQIYRYYWKTNEDFYPMDEPPKSAATYPLPFFKNTSAYPMEIMIYQNADSATAYINGKLLSQKKFKAGGGKVIFNEVQRFSSSSLVTLFDTYIATGKLAWRLKEVLSQSAAARSSGVYPYADKFNISLSGGINKSKQRRGKNANEVAEAQANYQTIDVKVKITQRPDSDLTYPAYVNVTYSYAYTEQWHVKHYMFGDINQEFERTDYVDRQYLLNSPSDVIEDSYSVEYAESVVSSDFRETASLKLKTDPVISVEVTGLALDPK
jgi:hypothetical protein